MKRASSVLFLVAAGLLALLLTQPASAGGCRSVSFVRHAPVYETPYVAPVTVIKEIERINYVNVARFVDYPLYSTFLSLYSPAVVGYQPQGYAPGAYAAPQSACEQKLAAQEERLRQLELKFGITPQQGQPRTAPNPMQKVENGGAEAPAPGDGSLFGLFTASRCVQCHDKANVVEKKGKTAFTEGGKMLQLAPEMVGEILNRITLEDNDPLVMPKRESGPPLTPQMKVRLTNKIVSGK